MLSHRELVFSLLALSRRSCNATQLTRYNSVTQYYDFYRAVLTKFDKISFIKCVLDGLGLINYFNAILEQAHVV